MRFGFGFSVSLMIPYHLLFKERKLVLNYEVETHYATYSES